MAAAVAWPASTANPPLPPAGAADRAERVKTLAALPLLAVALRPGPARAGCDLPLPEAGSSPLPRVAAALAVPAPRLDVLVVGSATVLGAPDRPRGGFPQAMASALEAARPGLSVRLTVHGKRGATAGAMLDVMKRELAHGHYAVVLWQTGTVEAVRRTPPATFAETLADGEAAVRAHGADLVLVDPLYSAGLEAHVDIRPYRAAMRASLAPGSALFDRYGLMRGWARAGLLDLDHTPKNGRRAVMARVDGCIGEALAQRLLGGAR